jgi:alpha-L-arabinofuranosidase
VKTATGKREIEIFVVNRDLTHPLTAKIQIEGATSDEKVAAAILNASDLNEWNGFESPQRVAIHQSDGKVEGGSLAWTFEPHSLTRLTFVTSGLSKN